MAEIFQVVGMALLAIGVFILSLFIAGWKMKRACDAILHDLRSRGAFDAVSAVDLPYARTSYFRFGLRDYRPKALEELLRQGAVRPSAEGRYFLDASSPAQASRRPDGPAGA